MVATYVACAGKAGQVLLESACYARQFLDKEALSSSGTRPLMSLLCLLASPEGNKTWILPNAKKTHCPVQRIYERIRVRPWAYYQSEHPGLSITGLSDLHLP